MPRHEYRTDPDVALTSQKKFVRRTAMQFGWKIQGARRLRYSGLSLGDGTSAGCDWSLAPDRRLSMPEDVDRQSAIDGEHLKLLSWGYVISGGIAACFSVFGLFYAFMGIFMGVVFSNAPVGKAAKMLPAFVASLFAGIGHSDLPPDDWGSDRQVLDGTLHQSTKVANLLRDRRGDHLHGISPRHGPGRPLPYRLGTSLGGKAIHLSVVGTDGPVVKVCGLLSQISATLAALGGGLCLKKSIANLLLMKST